MDFCILRHSTPQSCLAVTNPSKDEEKPRHRISPCMDVASWTIASILTFLSPSTTPILYHVKDEAKSDIATHHPCQCCTMSKTKQKPTSHLSVHGPTSPNQVKDAKQIQRHISPYNGPNMYSHTRRATHFLRLMPSPTPSSEDDVLSRPAKRNNDATLSRSTCTKLRQEVLTSRVHSKRHGVEESRRLAAATHRHQKT